MFNNPSEFEYNDCCTHYREKGYWYGYIVHPIFKIRMCRNCGDTQAIWGFWADILFNLFARWVWDGTVYITTLELLEDSEQ